MGLLDNALQMASGLVGKAASATAEIAAKISATQDAKAQKRKSYTATPDEAKALALLSEPKRVRYYTMEAYERLWTRCILYTAGVQHLQPLDNYSRTFVPKRAEEWVPMPVINKIQAKVARGLDFFTRNRPTGYIEPLSASVEDKDASDLAESVQNYLWLRLEEDDLYEEAANWLLTTGNTFRKSYVDTSLKFRYRIPQFVESNEPVMGADGQPIINPMTGQPVLTNRWQEKTDEYGSTIYDEVAEGEVACEVVAPMAMTVPMASRRLGMSPWIMETELYPTETLRMMFPDKADYLPETGSILTSDLYTHRLTSILASNAHGIARILDPYVLEGYAVVNLYEKQPSLEYPNGLLLIECDGIPLYMGELPLRNRYSYEHCGYFRVAGRFWCRGMVEDLLQPQDQINKLEQTQQMWDAFQNFPTTFAPQESGIAEGAMKRRPGMVIRYKYPFKPETENPTPLPAHIIQRRAIYDQDIEDQSMVRNVLMGNAPAGVTAGVALNRLGEEAEGGFEPVAKRWSRFIERCETSKLDLVQRFYTTERYLCIAGEDGTVKEVKDFIGSDLRGNTRWKMEEGSFKPRSKAARVQALLDAVNAGLMNDVLAQPGEIDRVLEQIGVSGFRTELGLDYERARWENEMLWKTQGWEQVTRMAGDDDMVHLKTHTSARKTKAWLRLPVITQQRHLMHEMEHLKAMLMAQGQSEPPDAVDEMQQDAEAGIQPGGASPSGEGEGDGGESAGGDDAGY